MTLQTSPKPEKSRETSMMKLIVATSIGNALEFYNIIVYAFLAIHISKAYFPAGDTNTGIILTFGTFALSFVIRPFGGIILGSIADTVGRKFSMMLCIVLMTLGTLLVAFLPTYASIGIWAPIGNLVARLLQGFAVGGQYGAATAYVVEVAPGRKGFMASWQFASQGAAGTVAALMGLLLTLYMPADALQAWGWRIPFIFGLLVAPVGLYILNIIQEPTAKVDKSDSEKSSPIRTVFAEQKGRLILAGGSLIVSTAVNYLIIYMPTYTIKQLGMSPMVGFAVTAAAYGILTIVTPITGHLSDSMGRMRLMNGSCVLLFLSFIPCFYAMTHYPNLFVVFVVIVYLSILKAIYYGPLASLMADFFPQATRATGLSISYNVAVTLFGGLTPLAMLYLSNLTGSNMAPAYYLMIMAILSFATLAGARKWYALD